MITVEHCKLARKVAAMDLAKYEKDTIMHGFKGVKSCMVGHLLGHAFHFHAHARIVDHVSEQKKKEYDPNLNMLHFLKEEVAPCGLIWSLAT